MYFGSSWFSITLSKSLFEKLTTVPPLFFSISSISKSPTIFALLIPKVDNTFNKVFLLTSSLYSFVSFSTFISEVLTAKFFVTSNSSVISLRSSFLQ